MPRILEECCWCLVKAGYWLMIAAFVGATEHGYEERINMKDE